MSQEFLVAFLLNNFFYKCKLKYKKNIAKILKYKKMEYNIDTIFILL